MNKAINEFNSLMTEAVIIQNQSIIAVTTKFYGFGVEYVTKEIKKSTGNKNITINIYKIQMIQ